MKWNTYDPTPFYDEVLEQSDDPRPVADQLFTYLKSLDNPELQARKAASKLCIEEMGVSFTIYSEGNNIDRD